MIVQRIVHDSLWWWRAEWGNQGRIRVRLKKWLILKLLGGYGDIKDGDIKKASNEGKKIEYNKEGQVITNWPCPSDQEDKDKNEL